MPERKFKPRKDRLYTYADYCTWPDDFRCEIIDGVIYDMTPAPGSTHQDVAGNLFGQLWNFFRGKPCKVYHAPLDVRLSEPGEEENACKTVVQPDIMVTCEKKRIDEKGLNGAPELVIEILSRSTASNDHIRKKALYERHGVKEYWLIDPANRLVTRYQQVAPAKFGPAQFFEPNAVIPVDLFPGLEIDFSQVFSVDETKEKTLPPEVRDPVKKRYNSGSPRNPSGKKKNRKA